MKFRINKSSEIAIFLQLKEQIKYYILSGRLQPGTRLPTPKELAAYLQINRNTVIASYKELEKENLLVTKQGQGTYISEKILPILDEKKRYELVAVARKALEKTLDLGFSPQDLYTVVFSQAVLGIDNNSKEELKALMVECNIPDLQYFQQVLQKELEIKVEGCLLSDLPDKINDELVIGVDFVVTTFFHIEDVRAILEPLGKDVLAIMAVPHLQTFIRIGQLKAGTRIGLVCATERGSFSMRRALEAAGLQHIHFENAGLDEKNKLEEMLKRVDWVVASRVAFDVVNAMVPPNVGIMRYYTILDQAGLQMIKQYLNKKMFSTGDTYWVPGEKK